MKIDRRDFLKLAGTAGVASTLGPFWLKAANAAAAPAMGPWSYKSG